MHTPVTTTTLSAAEVLELSTLAPLRSRLKKRRPVPASPKCKKIALPTLEGFIFEKVSRILYLEAKGNYTALHLVDGRQVLLSRSLGEMDCLLPEGRFVRIHRSFTIHLKHVVRYIRNKYGAVVLSNGATLNISPTYREAFMMAMSRYCYGFRFSP